MLSKGDVFRSRYQIITHLGSGLVGDVYRARDLQNPQDEDGDVALKVLRDPTWARAIRDEVENLTKLRTAARGELARHVPALIEPAPDHDPPYLALEFMRGERLLQRLAHHASLPEALSLNITMQLCSVLQLVHDELKMTYIDLKLENLWWEPDPKHADSDGLLRLTDWNVLQPRPMTPAPA